MRFITGLPRSRTKWFADYFDGLPNINGYHEPLNGLHSKDSFYDLCQRPNVVISDSGLHITDFQERFPDHKTVLIERPIDDVFSSLLTYFHRQALGRPSYAFLSKQQRDLAKLEGLRVPYSEINNRLEEIHEYLDIPYDALYAQRMKGQNRQVEKLEVDVDSYKLWGIV